MSGVSILILTKNEQQDLPGCLASVAWSDDIQLYDSLSTDDTLAIARRAGAHITQRPFDNWAAHQNWGLRNIRFKHPWVFYIDADERMTPELVRAVQAASEDELTEHTRRHLARFLEHGTTTVEAKSGYGLDRATEIKQLEVMADLNRLHPLDVVPTEAPARSPA